MTPTECPSPDVLEQFRLGQSPKADVPALEQHLHSCPACVGRLSAAPVDDPLVLGLRAQRGRPRLRNPLLERARQEARALRPSVPAQQTPPTVVSTNAPAGVLLPLVGAEQAFFFLAPPRGPDEMGWLGCYRVLRVLGEGGMGVVLQAEDTRLQRQVALKVMRPLLAADPEARRRFLREARATAALEHEHVVTIHHTDEVNGVPYLAMPLLRGETLEERLKREGKLLLAEVVRIGRETAEGLAAAHAKGLIHRDVKPGNLWLEAGRGRVKILDFGLAYMAASEGDRTLPGALLGTPGYMAPEQTENHADHRSDLFSLGCVLYRMATGENPFAGVTPLQKLRNTLLETPRSPQEINPSLPAPLCHLILRLLAHKPEDRPASAAAIARVLETIEAQSRPGRPPVAVAVPAGPPAAVPVATAAPPPKLDPRWLYLGGAVVAVLLLLIVALAWPARKRPDSGKPEDHDTDRTDAAKNIARPNARGRVRPATPPRPEEEVVPDRSFTETWVARPQPIEGLKSWCIETDAAGKVTPLRFEFTADERLLIRYNTTPAWQQFDPKTCGLVPVPFDGSYLALTADTRMCARVGEGGVQLWEEGSPTQRITLRSPGPVYDATFSPDGGKIITFDQAQAGGAPQTVWFWHVREGSKLGNLAVPGLALSATARAWSPDSKALAVGSPSGVALFRAPWKEAKVLRRPQGVTALSWSPDGKLLATVGQDRKVHLLDEGGEVAEQTQLPVAASASLVPAWSPDGREVAVATEDRKVVVWDRKAKRLTYHFKGHTRPVHAVAFLGDGKTLVSASQGSVRFWNLVKGGLRGTLLNLGGSAWLAVSPEGYYRGSAGVEGRFVFHVREDKDQLRDFSPENFRNLYGWKNQPERVKLSSD